jgi:hypothetical protein
MTKYSLKQVFYKNSALLNEMALITPKNFLEKVIKLCKEKPQLIGDPTISSVEEAFDKIDDNLYKKRKYLTAMQTNEFLYKLKAEYESKEKDRQKSVDIRKSKGIKVNEKDLTPITLSEKEKEYQLELYEATSVKEKNIALEIIKIVHVTKLLELKGKENKSKLKEAEEILIKQLRKHKNSDGEFIEFKKVLPMFDSIIQYIEKSVDVDIDTCIKAADLYMRVYYDIARKEEKDEIEKGNFDFNIIMKRMTFAKGYKKIAAVGKMLSESLLKVYEDDDMLIVYPTNYKAFKHMLGSVLGASELTWCTYRSESTWSSYNSSQYVAVAHSKKDGFGEDAYAISLKVRKDGTIDVEGTCDFHNNHVDDEFLDEYITNEMKTEISNLPEQVSLQSNISEIEDNVIGLSKLNDVNELKNCFSQSLAFSGVEQTMGLYELMCTETQLSKEDAAEVIVDSVAYYIFDNLDAETLYFTDFFLTQGMYPREEIYNNLKNKILNQRSHPRYFNAFAEIQKKTTSVYSFKQLNFNEFKSALGIACNTNNANNLKRIIKLALDSDEYSSYLNPYKVQNKSAGLTKQNIEIYDMIMKSQGIKSYISEFGTNSLNKITGGLSSGRSFRPDVFISHLIFRYPEIFVNNLQEKSEDSSEDLIVSIDLSLVTRYIIKDASAKPSEYLSEESNDERRFLSLDKNAYQEIKENVLTEYKTFRLIKDYLGSRDAYVLYRLIGSNIEKGNPLNVSYNQDEFDIFNDLTSYKDVFKSNDYFANFITFLSAYKKNATDLNTKTLKNIADHIDRSYNNDELADTATCQSFFETVILDNATRDFDFEYAYEIFKTLPDSLRAFIITKTFHKARISILRGKRNIDNVINHIQNKSKIFVKSSNFIDNYYSLHRLQIPKFTFLILTFLDFIPMEKRKVYFSQFVEQLFSRDNTNYESTHERSLATNAIQKIDMEIIGSDETINALRKKINHVISHYGKVELHTLFTNSLINIFTQNNKAFPKDIMQKIATLSTGQNYNSANGIKNFFKNFIGISEDGSNSLYGKELTIVRETLKELFRDRKFNSNSSMFGTRYSKEIAFEIVQKMGKHARMHMGMAFPDEASNLSANTPEEEAELQMDSLIRQYVKMLLS